MSEVITFEPRKFPGVTIDRDTTIITSNHLGADMGGDAGFGAQYLADVSGRTVIGLNRIGSGNDAKFSKRLAQIITENPTEVTSRWVETIGPALRSRAPSRVELVGRSAGANLMLHVAALQLIPATAGILAVEALRLQPINNTRIGQLRYMHYQLCREGRFKKDIDNQVDADLPQVKNEHPKTAADLRLRLARQLTDIRHYQHLWVSDLPYWNGLEIAQHVAITSAFLFAEESMAADAEKMPVYLAAFNQAREGSGLQKSLLAKVVPRTTHGSFDDHRLYATHYRRYAAMAAADQQ